MEIQRPGGKESLFSRSLFSNLKRSFKQGTCGRRHKGPQDTNVASQAISPQKGKRSARRRQALMHKDGSAIVRRSRDNRTTASAQALLSWVSNSSAQKCFLPDCKQADGIMGLEAKPSLKSAATASSSQPMPPAVLIDTTSKGVINTAMFMRSNLQAAGVTSNPDSTPVCPAAPTSHHAPQVEHSTPCIPSPIDKARIIVFADGKELHYTSNDVPDPPIVTAEVSGLACIWDESFPDWDGSAPLRIKTIPIGLKHWRSVYTHHEKGSRIWTGIKQSWHTWKVFDIYRGYTIFLLIQIPLVPHD